MHRMGAIKSAIGDAVITFLWVFCVSTIGALTSIISSALQVQGFAPNLLIITFLIAVLVFFFNLIAHALGGASFNPTGIAAFYAAGIGGDSLISLAVRFPSQAAGAVGGVLAIVEFMPSQYKHMLGGPSVKVDLHTAAIAEGLLTFLISFAVLWIVIKGPRSMVVKSLMLAVTTVTLVVSGSGYTGPAMNPANAYGWAFIKNRHNTVEQFYVYWICPFIGAISAAWFFRILFPLPSPKTTKVKKA
ncbi:aquaporin SIP1-1 isoform X1 [Dendrobium catenatum]|uniref:Aquaporin SIP1-2 n=1 Tax=Dendrobium catenatum TaxID=906689 RepID=A0A2I0WSN5_9ASPA|nr:aquaporin SIP1-1 isoform X1 [Dendrobium catenatum]PKU78657.1 Aquaporin SIP1-2 [Dendrobium catenatum]